MRHDVRSGERKDDGEKVEGGRIENTIERK